MSNNPQYRWLQKIDSFRKKIANEEPVDNIDIWDFELGRKMIQIMEGKRSDLELSYFEGELVGCKDLKYYENEGKILSTHPQYQEYLQKVDVFRNKIAHGERVDSKLLQDFERNLMIVEIMEGKRPDLELDYFAEVLIGYKNVVKK